MSSRRTKPTSREGLAAPLVMLSGAPEPRDPDAERQAERFRAVLEIGAQLASARDLDGLLRTVIDRLTELLGADAATLFMLDAERGELWSRVLRGSALKEIRFPARAGIAGHVVRSGESVRLADAYEDRRFNPDIDRQSGFRTRSLVAAPLLHVSGRVLGVLEVLHRRTDAFDPDDLALVEAVARQVAAVLDNLVLREQLEKRNAELLRAQDELSQALRDLDALYEVERAVSSAEREAELLDRILERACAVTGATAASLLLSRDDSEGTLFFRSARGEKREELLTLTLQPGQGIAGHVAASGETVRLERASDSPLHARTVARRLGVHAGAVLCVPVQGEDGLLGALELLNKPGGFDGTDERFATLLAGQTGRALQLRRAREEGEKRGRMAAVGKMLSSVMHDLRTPMTILRGYAELMQEEEGVKARRAHGQVLERQFEHIEQMMHETLAFARGERQVLLARVSLERFVEEVAEHLRVDLAEDRVELKVVLGYRGWARLDAGKMKRLVYNIARNAQQAMPAGGRFTLAVEREGAELVLRFTDTGHGIPAEISDRLFETFVTANKPGGTGLGLALVKRVAEEHGGSVSFKSRPGKGTTFEVRLPLGVEAQD